MNINSLFLFDGDIFKDSQNANQNMVSILPTKTNLGCGSHSSAINFTVTYCGFLVF